MDPKKTQKLRALVYAGLAGGLVGVSTYSAAAHGNASPATPGGAKISWDADDFVVQKDAATKAEVASTQSK